MREILFRGKTPITGKWIFGTGVLYDSINTWIVSNPSLQPLAFGEKHFTAIPETVGQYTGLTDKNGKKIFDGDIVKFDNIIGIINYNEGCYCIKTKKPDWRNRNNPAIDIVMNEYPNEIEVIGNIHDNPELIGGDTND
jgi:uncharacterized phage protein (TIGR01671 family)